MTEDEKYGLAEAVGELAKLARSAHDPARITTACFCVCGSGMGGPAGPPACKALKAIRQVISYFAAYAIDHPRARIPDHIREMADLLDRVI